MRLTVRNSLPLLALAAAVAVCCVSAQAGYGMGEEANTCPDGYIPINDAGDLLKIGVDPSYPLSGKYLQRENISLFNYLPLSLVFEQQEDNRIEIKMCKIVNEKIVVIEKNSFKEYYAMCENNAQISQDPVYCSLTIEEMYRGKIIFYGMSSKGLVAISFHHNGYLDAITIPEIGLLSPIGDKENPFTGEYNGNGFVIENFQINNILSTPVGLFSVVKNATIHNLSINEAKIRLDKVSTEKVSISAVVGHSTSSSLKNIRSNFLIESGIFRNDLHPGNLSFSINIGGILGEGTAEMENCFSSGNIIFNLELIKKNKSQFIVNQPGLINIGGVGGKVEGITGNNLKSNCFFHVKVSEGTNNSSNVEENHRIALNIGGIFGEANDCDLSLASNKSCFKKINSDSINDDNTTQTGFSLYYGGIVGNIVDTFVIDKTSSTDKHITNSSDLSTFIGLFAGKLKEDVTNVSIKEAFFGVHERATDKIIGYGLNDSLTVSASELFYYSPHNDLIISDIDCSKWDCSLGSEQISWNFNNVWKITDSIPDLLPRSIVNFVNLNSSDGYSILIDENYLSPSRIIEAERSFSFRIIPDQNEFNEEFVIEIGEIVSSGVATNNVDILFERGVPKNVDIVVKDFYYKNPKIFFDDRYFNNEPQPLEKKIVCKPILKKGYDSFDCMKVCLLYDKSRQVDCVYDDNFNLTFNQDTFLDNLFLTASPVPTIFKIELVDESVIKTIEYTVETESFDITSVERIGYLFKGWVYREKIVNKITIEKGSTENKRYAGVWEKIQYFIHFVNEDGVAPPSMPITYGDVIPNLQTVSKNGHYFECWNGINGSVKQGDIFNYPFDLTLVAQFKPFKYNIILKDIDDYGLEKRLEITYGVSVNLPSASDSVKSVFVNWISENGETYENGAEVINLAERGDVVLKAQWKLKTYRVYVPNITGMEFRSPASVEHGSEFLLEFNSDVYNVKEVDLKVAGAVAERQEDGKYVLKEVSDDVRIEMANLVPINLPTVEKIVKGDVDGFVLEPEAASFAFAVISAVMSMAGGVWVFRK